MAKKYYFSTKDLVAIAMLSALGGALSVYIGYLGNLVNTMAGVPFGAGQFMAGLHVLWIILAAGITKKKGAATMTGTVKGAIELFMGSTHGIVVVLVSICQGAIIDAILFSDKAKEDRNLVHYSAAAALSSASNFLVFQAFYFSGISLPFILIFCTLAGISGVIFGGWLSIQLMEALEEAAVLARSKNKKKSSAEIEFSPAPRKKSKTAAYISVVVSIIFVAAFTLGAVYFAFFVYAPFSQSGVAITGNVASGYLFIYDNFKNNETTINAELNGSVTHVPARNYTGIPLEVVLSAASPNQGASSINVKAKDGYSATFSNLSAVLTDSRLIITFENGEYRLVAANYDGAYWIREMYEIDVR